MTVDEVTARRRPRNRRQLIVDAAGPVFSARGYHGASMEEVAAEVGITAAALYRHFPNKYALFVECANLMVDRLLRVLEEQSDAVGLPGLLRALAEETLDHRASGGVYRWEARYLEAEDRGELRGKFAAVVDGVTDAVERELGGTQPRLRAAAALGAIGSITLHRTPIARQRAEDLLVAAALGVAEAEPGAAPASGSLVHLPSRPEPASRRAEILQAAIPLFAERGFPQVSMGQIARAVGLSPSAIYRHYPVKADILAAACLQTAGLLEQAVGQALQGVRGPRDSVAALAAAFVAYSFENTELISVAEAEIVGLPPELQRPVTLAQREHVAVWERWLGQVRPELDARQTRTLVHAGFGVVVEAGRGLHWQDTGEHRDGVTALLLGALGVPA
ncbi:TetR/AcrR family transcriptional regulator [Nocardioides campestrisoli]|uniref:TetR/AcrR family transcriptional regulator n=1 Tax=Nocardioides campestrisoli TaxID=2736757 RepID=UPI0015E7C36E|nr:TetR/AcrR family transcriptional regulator [Nocardioides campestrisoli]